MLTAHLALLLAAAFAGTALYVSTAEHPARMTLDEAPALAQWKPAYARGKFMQALLALAGGLLALWTWWESGNLLWLLGGVLLLANWPFTLLAILPTSRRLEAIHVETPDPDTRDLLVRWGQLHAVRTALGIAAALVMLTAFHAQV